uniref:Major facilitator superfamily (MFS) profile domain-containing protein n=1 Tax=Panagrolaimus sp. JU765 TaxID=591449 RepID=A0AC34QU67_9BILA
MFTWTYFLTVSIVLLGGSTQFYSYGIVNPEQELITGWINATYLARTGVALSETSLNLIWSAVVSSIAIGAIFGAAITRTLGERFGRRNSLVINGVINVFGALLELLAKPAGSYEFLIIGRLILGLNMGLTSGLIPMYLMEITPNKYRGAAGTLHQVAVAFSDWFSLFVGLPQVLGSSKLWPWAFSFPGLPALALVLILPFCPESPKFMLMTLGKREEALESIKRLVVEDEAQPMFRSLIKEAALNAREGTATFKELFTRKDLRIPLCVSILVMIAQQFTGCTAVFAYSTDMFVNANLDISTARFATLGIGIVYFLFACSSPFLIEKKGRRFLSLFQLTGCSVALAFLAVFTFVQQKSNNEWASYGSILALVAYMSIYGVGSPIPWMITGELFNTKFRATAVTVAVFTAWTFAFIVSSLYLPFQQLVGVSFSYLPFIVVSIFSIAFIYFLLPETREKNVDDIVSEIRFRSQSLTIGQPFRHVPEFSVSESRRLLPESEPADGHVNEYHTILP